MKNLNLFVQLVQLFALELSGWKTLLNQNWSMLHPPEVEATKGVGQLSIKARNII